MDISPIDSARRLASDFNVIIHDNFKPGEPTRNKASPQKIVTYREREDRVYRLLAEYCKYLEDCRIRYAPHSPEERPHPLFVHSLHNLEISRYYQKILIFRIQNECTEFIKENNNKSARIFSVIESNDTIIIY